MRTLRLWLIVLAILVPSLADANDHVAGFYSGVSFDKGSTLTGFHEVIDIVIPKPWEKNCSIVSDLSVNFGKHDDDTHISRVTSLFGVRVALVKNDGKPHRSVLFANGLAGVTSDSKIDEKNHRSLAVGGGWEYVLKHIDRAGDGGPALRGQIDYVAVHNHENFWRFSVGFVYRLGRTP
jgi:hypothetical protein